MTLSNRGTHWYGDNQADLRLALTQHGEQKGCSIDDDVGIQCGCGKDAFKLWIDEAPGVCVRECTSCKQDKILGNTAALNWYSGDFYQLTCICKECEFQVVAGVHLNSTDAPAVSDNVGRVFLGCRCISCGCLHFPADWNDEHQGSDNFMKSL